MRSLEHWAEARAESRCSSHQEFAHVPLLASLCSVLASFPCRLTPHGGKDGSQHSLLDMVHNAYYCPLSPVVSSTFLISGLWLLFYYYYFAISHPRPHNLS